MRPSPNPVICSLLMLESSTLSFPVHGTLMIEPTESESLAELDNFVHVMLTIWDEIQEVKNGEADTHPSSLRLHPHR